MGQTNRPHIWMYKQHENISILPELSPAQRHKNTERFYQKFVLYTCITYCTDKLLSNHHFSDYISYVKQKTLEKSVYSSQDNFWSYFCNDSPVHCMDLLLVIAFIFSRYYFDQNAYVDLFVEQHQNPPDAWKKDLESSYCENRQERDRDNLLTSSSLFTASCMKYNRSGFCP